MRASVVAVLLLASLPACTGSGADSATDSVVDSGACGPTIPGTTTAYSVLWSTDPDPVVAGEQAQFTEQIVDQNGCPVGDLQQNHERMVHNIFVSSDWTSFTHTHQEDFTPITADNLKTATFSFPVTLPLSGRYFTMFDYAAEDKWLQTNDAITLTGSPAQAAAPDLTVNDCVTVNGVTACIAWTTQPVATYEADWSMTITLADGTPINDVTQYLGADAHCVIVDSTTTWGSHTHAWFPDMNSMTPGMQMPHLYDGSSPIPFVYTFPAAGTYKMWVQFVRSADPTYVYDMPFVFTVAG